MKVLLTGSEGQIGRSLTRQLQGKADVLACSRDTLDITDREAVFAQIDDFRPQIVINAAAYTAVDKAESEPASAEAVNHQGARYLAEATAKAGAALLHISTDYVFNGNKKEAYRENDPIDPQGVYGRSKAAGEQAALQTNPRTIVLRTSWVFGEYGQNFVKTMLRLARERDTLSVVDDQLGAPTYAGDIAAALIAISEHIVKGKPVDYGIYHYSGMPYVSWYAFAYAIFAESVTQRVLPKAPQLKAITTADYPTPAKRPTNSRLNLDKIQRAFAIPPSDWKRALKSLHLYG